MKEATGATFEPSATGMLQTAAYTLGTTPLALAYLAAAALAWSVPAARRTLEWFCPLGRMALSVYLSQTAVAVALFTGCGLGLAGRLPIAALPLLAGVLLLAQRQLCSVWLARHAQGPMEWLWRRVTYRRGTWSQTASP
jgi:uncharacterized protein